MKKKIDRHCHICGKNYRHSWDAELETARNIGFEYVHIPSLGVAKKVCRDCLAILYPQLGLSKKAKVV